MPIDSVQLLATNVTPAQQTAVAAVLTANPGTFIATVDGFDGPIEEFTPNSGLTIVFSSPWSAAKSTALTAVVDELD